MKTKTRFIIAAIILIIFVGALLTVDYWRQGGFSSPTDDGTSVLSPGSIPIYLNDTFLAGFTPDDLASLEKVCFVEATEGKMQEGWLLSQIILLHVEATSLVSDSIITISSSSRVKSVDLTWTEVEDPSNTVMFDLSNRGTLKLVSRLEKMDTPDEWIQDVDKIVITLP